MLERVRRIKPAMTKREIANAGKMKWSRPPLPKVGSTFNWAPKNMMRRIATQNWGADIPIMANTLLNLSNIVFLLTADRIPSGTPNATATSKPAAANWMVAGILSSNISVTGRRLTTDRPNSPVRMSPR